MFLHVKSVSYVNNKIKFHQKQIIRDGNKITFRLTQKNMPKNRD